MFRDIKLMLRDIIHIILIKLKWKNKLICAYSSRINKTSFFEGANRISKRTTFSGKMGYGSYMGLNCFIQGEIGRFTSIGSYCNVIIGRHPYTSPFVTTSPMFFSVLKQNGYTFTDKQLFNENKYVDEANNSISIGSDCWIGNYVKIVEGVRINDGAVVLAGAIVTKDIPPYAIAAGIPARIIKYRYDNKTIEFLLKNKWWLNDIKWIKKNWKIMTNIDEYKNNYHELTKS